MKPVSDFDVINCTLQGTTLLEASAGTGKTWNICGLYLRLLLEQKLDVQQILVVTFTNAATAELRDRIRQRIVDMRDYLSGKTSFESDIFISDLAAKLQSHSQAEEPIQRLELALQTFDEAAIFTIHSFCQRALADSAFAAGQPFALELVPDDSAFLMEAVHDFWRKHIASGNMSNELATFLLQKNDSPEKYAKLLKRHMAKPLARVEWPERDTANTSVATLDDIYTTAKTKWAAQRDDIVELLNPSLGTLNKGSYKENTIQTAVDEYNHLFEFGELLEKDEKKSKLKLLRSSFLKNKTNKGKATPSHSFFELSEAYFHQRQQARLQLVRHMLEETSQSLPKRKRERRVQSFDDLLNNMHTALSRGDYPWLASSLQQRFPAALVDEFQDTDPQQFEIFNRIYGNDSAAPLFFVGDPKQAIYSFRNADLETYFKARQRATAIYSIRNNQRSTQGLIGAVNQIFSANSGAFMHDDLVFQEAGHGRMSEAVLTDHSGEHVDLQLWMLPKNESGEHIERSKAMQCAANATAAEISRLIDAANRNDITMEDQPLRAGDMAVLVRSHAQGRRIRQALERLNVGCVELSQASVFKSVDAEEVERILTAVWSPTRLAHLRAALVTELIGCDASKISDISADEAELMHRTQTFADYRERWLRHGIAHAYRHILSNEGISKRMLLRPDGERRMTNLLHLGELLQQAAEFHPAPDALLRWLQTQRRETSTDEAAQLRLESDQNLVKIMTIHKSKGLQFPVVFCPFLWDGYRNSRNTLEGREYHDSEGKTVLDFRPEAGDNNKISEQIRLETDAEDLRLTYVALTRAVYRCYLVAGCYARSHFGRLSHSESTRSLLNWLVAGKEHTADKWKSAKLETTQVEAAWQTLADNNDGIKASPLLADIGKPLDTDWPKPDTLVCQALPASISTGWRISSYSGLSRGAVHENAASDHDTALPFISEDTADLTLPDDDILLFPKGASAGECIHRAFELCDFRDQASYDAAIEQALIDHPQGQATATLHAILHRMMADVLHTPLADGIVLSGIAPQQRLTEMGFHLSLSKLSANKLNQTLQKLAYNVPHLHFANLTCYLKGFIDLVFEHQGRFYILDWKSNYLGNTNADYGHQKASEAMAGNGYHLQYLLYTVALHRHLAQRLPDYRYDTHFGGVLYLFVRGVRPGWQNADGTASGVFFERPTESAILELDTMFKSESMKAA